MLGKETKPHVLAAAWAALCESRSRVSSRVVCNTIQQRVSPKQSCQTSSCPTPVISFWMMPSSENSPTHVTSIDPVPFITAVPDSRNGFFSADFLTSSDSPVSADSSHEMSDPWIYNASESHSSMAAGAQTRMPSAGKMVPGENWKMSPTCDCVSRHFDTETNKPKAASLERSSARRCGSPPKHWTAPACK